MDSEPTNGVAVVGMACRFHGARSPEQLWEKLTAGVELIERLSDEELTAAGERPGNLADPQYVKAGGFVEDFDKFDAAVFGWNPKEAEILDPQFRQFMECSWEALEDASCVPEKFDGRIGVYGGNGWNHYYQANIRPNGDLRRSVGMLAIHVANDRDYLATRVSYALNLHGPGITVQTACSTSLVAICLAAESVLTFESDLALAGGVYLQLRRHGYRYEEGGIVSPDGHCRTFDAKAKGTIFNSGVGVVALKRLSDAIRDGDRIYATIRGFALNNDGDDKVGFMAPSVSGQTAVIRDALAMAKVNPEEIGYVEAHGTATELGDPIEIAALTKAYRERTERSQYCAVGSVKTNLGHTNSAAGVAGFIKAVLSLKHGSIPPNIHFESPNPAIDFENSPFFVNNTLLEWKRNGKPRFAGVSSFGVGGTNAHVILEEAPVTVSKPVKLSRQVVPLSALTDTALDAVTDRVAQFLDSQDASVEDVAYTLQSGRKAFPRRRVLVSRGKKDAIRALRELDPERVLDGFVYGDQVRPVFMFPGQGAQQIGMAGNFYRHNSTFREVFDECAALLEPRLGKDLRDLLYSIEPNDAEERAVQLKQTSLTQPALFVVEYSLAKVLMKWGITPESMVGHSIGEYVAACLSGVFSLEDALGLVAERGRLMQSMPSGGMLAVALPEDALVEKIGGHVSVAAVNAPSLCVVSGPHDELDSLEKSFEAEGLFVRRLLTSHAFHSGMMDPILEEFEQTVSRVNLHAPKIPFLSNLTGTWIIDDEAVDPGYWARHLRGAVRFEANVSELLQSDDRVLIEVGPGQTLQTLVKQHSDASDTTVTACVLPPGGPDGSTDEETVLLALGRLWVAGADVDWQAAYTEPDRPRRVSIPTYPFEKHRYWLEEPPPVAQIQGPAGPKKLELSEWFSFPTWRRSRSPGSLPFEDLGDDARWLVFLDEHGIGERLVHHLEREDVEVFSVVAGAKFARTGERTFALRPGDPADYDQLFAVLCEEGTTPLRVVYAWPVAPDRKRPDTEEQLEELKDRCFYGILHLAQSIGRWVSEDEVRLDILSTALHDVTGSELCVPEKALLLGPSRVVDLELQNVRCRAIDLDPDEVFSDIETTASVLAELKGRSSDSVVSLRRGVRWVESFEPVQLDSLPETGFSVRKGGVYLVTGGLGGIGLTLAEDLALRFKAKLILTGRSDVPPREDWDAWLDAHDGSDRWSEVIEKMRSWEAEGAEVMALRADVSVEEDVRRAVTLAEERWGKIDGVIHSAGVPAGGLVQLKERSAAEEVLNPKLHGTLVLERVFAGSDLDFLAVFSSVTSVLGVVGQVDYAAANSFLDAFASRADRKVKAPTLAINWDMWHEVGMAARSFQRPNAPAIGAGGSGEPAEEIEFEEARGPLLDRVGRNNGSEVYAGRLNPAEHWVLGEHRMLERPMLVGTAYLEILNSAFRRHRGDSATEISEVTFMSPIMTPDSSTVEVRTTLKADGDKFDVTIQSRSDAQGAPPRWIDNAIGRLAQVPREDAVYSIDEIRSRCSETEHGQLFDEGNDAVEETMSFGPRWQNLRYNLYLGSGEALAVVSLPDEYQDDLSDYPLHPALMDAALSITAYRARGEEGFLPFSYGRVVVCRDMTSTVYSHVVMKGDRNDEDFIVVDALILDGDGNVLVKVEDFTMKRARLDAFRTLQERSKGKTFSDPKRERPGGGYPAIRPAEGVDAFHRALSAIDVGQIVVSTTSITARKERKEGSLVQAARTLEQVTRTLDQDVTKKAAYSRPALRVPYVAPRNELEESIAEIWQATLGIAGIGVNDPFLDLGGNSLVGVQIATRLRETFHVVLPPADFFKAPTVGALAEVVAQKLIRQIDDETLDELLSDLESAEGGGQVLAQAESS